MEERPVTVPELVSLKGRGRPIVMVTAYDTPGALAADAAGVDAILVGDSLGNVVLGYPSTLPVTMAETLHHLKAVRRGVKRALLIADMPFMSYQISPERALENAGRLVQKGGAQAVKFEGGRPVFEMVRRIVAAEIPVMGHLGLTPQAVNRMGGYRVQARSTAAVRRLLDDALGLEQAGAFALVLEGIPAAVAERLSPRLSIPTIGIGAGPGCDGQVLVYHDLLGLTPGARPAKFVKEYARLADLATEAMRRYAAEVRERTFPGPEHTYDAPADLDLEAAFGQGEIDA